MNNYGPANDNIPAAELRLAERYANNQARIKASNVEFEKLGPFQKRVAIARDVLAWLRTGNFKPTKGTYVETDACDLKDVVNGEESCNVCALGAMFAAVSIRTGNTCSVDDWVGGGATFVGFDRAQLEPYFTVDELNNIENAFEGYSRYGHDLVNPPDCFEDERHFNQAAVDFNKGVRSPRERMERIMRNIIRHGGRFIP